MGFKKNPKQTLVLISMVMFSLWRKRLREIYGMSLQLERKKERRRVTHRLGHTKDVRSELEVVDG